MKVIVDTLRSQGLTLRQLDAKVSRLRAKNQSTRVRNEMLREEVQSHANEHQVEDITHICEKLIHQNGELCVLIRTAEEEVLQQRCWQLEVVAPSYEVFQGMFGHSQL